MNYCLVINPHSRNGKSAGRSKEVLEKLRRYERNVDAVYVQDYDEISSLSRTANMNGYDVIVAIGGDGTINRVLNGFYNVDGELISNAKLGVVHTGTSPDLCKSYNIPLDIDRAVNALHKRQIRHIPVGRIRFEHYDTSTNLDLPLTGVSVSYFASCANIGLGAELARMANSGIRSQLGDIAGTFVSLLNVLKNYKPHSIETIIDDKQAVQKHSYNISIGLTPFIASGIRFPIIPQDKQNKFYVMMLSGLNILNFVPALYKLYHGKPIRNTDYLSIRKCTTIQLRSRDRSCETEYDGDPSGMLPCTIDMAPQAIPIIC